MLRRLTIQAKLFLATLFILVVTFIILIYTSVSSMNDFSAKEVERDLEANLKYLRSRYLQRAEQVRNTLALPVVAQPVRERVEAAAGERLQETVQRWHRALPFVELLTIVDARHRVLTRLNGRPGGDPFAAPRLLETVFQRQQPMVSTELLSHAEFCAEGQTEVCEKLPPGKDLMVLTVVLPILAEDGRLIGGVVAGDVLNNDPHISLEAQQVFGKEVKVAITCLGERIAGSLSKDNPFAAPLDQRILQRLKSGFAYRGAVAVGNRSYQMMAEPLTNSTGAFIGSLAVALSIENYHQIRRDNLRNIVLAGVCSITLAFGLIWWLARRFSRPLRELAAGSTRIEAGDYSSQIGVASIDEFGELAQAFNRMAASLAERDRIIRQHTEELQELNELLELRVVDRTAQLRQEMGMLGAILTSMADGVVVTDRKNRIIHFNPAAQKIFKLAPEDILDQPFATVCSRGEFCPLAGQLEEMAATGDPAVVREMELTALNKKLKTTISPLLDEGGRFSGVVMSIRDVTLEYEVDRMKSEFIATVSHELKTPLTSMKGSLQFILHKGKWLTGTERELLGVCLRNTERLIRLITSILDISRIEAGTVEFDMKPQTVGGLLMYAIEEMKGLALSRNISVVNSVHHDLPLILGDHDRLIQVLTNLLSNAIKFSPPGTVVMLSAERTDEFVSVAVSDHAKTIRPEDRDKLFSKFQQLEGSDSGDYGGTGLGLAICREIITKHGGQIYHQPGGTDGNTFIFTIPVHKGETP
jgi:two-component system sensor histidine kinase VicK